MKNIEIAINSSIMDKLLELPVYVLVTTGRTGSDFMQSLLDSHSEVLTFNGNFLFHNFWEKSLCVKSGEFDLGDFIDEFSGHFIERLKSRYDLLERKNKLGDDYNQCININIPQFKEIFIKLLTNRKPNSKNVLVAIYAAYSISLGQDINSKKILFHHEHSFLKLHEVIADFPDCKVLCTTRDPRATFVSGILHWKAFDVTKDNEQFLHLYIKRILEDAEVLEKYNREYRVIKLEDMGNEKILNSLCQWLGILYDETLKTSTWAGLSWHGDALSPVKNKTKGWSSEMLVNHWEKKLSWYDMYIFNYIMYHRLKCYGYKCKRISIFDTLFVPLFILFPLRFELRFFSFEYIRKYSLGMKIKVIVMNIIWYIFRIGLFYKHYFRVASGKVFFQPLLKEKEQ